VDYASLAAAFGVEAFRLSELSILAQQLERFCHDPHPMLVEVPITLNPSPLVRSIVAASVVSRARREVITEDELVDKMRSHERKAQRDHGYRD
jgi:hypothetical protein